MTTRGRNRTILVADDEPEIVDLVRLVLEWEGYTVLEAPNGADAWSLAQANVPDLIFLDMRMPKMGGQEVLEHLQSDQALANIPVVMLSVMTTNAQVKTALETGAIAYLPKPFELGEMMRLVKNILSQDDAGLDIIRQNALRKLDAQP